MKWKTLLQQSIKSSDWSIGSILCQHISSLIFLPPFFPSLLLSSPPPSLPSFPSFVFLLELWRLIVKLIQKVNHHKYQRESWRKRRHLQKLHVTWPDIMAYYKDFVMKKTFLWGKTINKISKSRNRSTHLLLLDLWHFPKQKEIFLQ